MSSIRARRNSSRGGAAVARRCRRACFVVAALVLAGCAGSPARDAVPAAPTLLPRAADAVYGYAVETLAPGVFALNQGNEFHLQPRGNVAVVEQSDGVVLVDSGGSPAGAEQVIAFVRGRTAKPVKAIVLTHWHGDHSLGVARLLREWPAARVIATAATRDMLAGARADAFMPGDDPVANSRYRQNVLDGIDFLRGAANQSALSAADRAGFAQAAREYTQFAGEMGDARRVPPTEVFDRELALPDAERPARVMFLGRANTAGDAIVWLPRQRVVITGDVVVAPIPFGFNTYPADWIEVLRKIAALDYAVLAPGHGSAQRDNDYLDRLIAMLDAVRGQVAPLAGGGDDAAAAAGRVTLEADRQRIAGDDPWLRRWFRDYWHHPVVSSALREARGQPVEQGAQ